MTKAFEVFLLLDFFCGTSETVGSSDICVDVVVDDSRFSESD